MSHLLTRRSLLTRDEYSNRFGNVLLNKLSSTLFSITTNLSNERYTVCLWVVLEHTKKLLKIKSNDWVTTNTDCCGLSQTSLCKVINNLVGKCTTTTDNTSMSLLEDISWHNTSHTLLWRNKTRTVRTNYLDSLNLSITLCCNSVKRWHALSNTNDEAYTTINGFKHSVFCEWGWDEDNRCVGSCCSNSILNCVEYRNATYFLTSLARRCSTNHVGAILLHL